MRLKRPSVSMAFRSFWLMALISVALRRFPFRLQPSDRPIVYASLLFFAVLYLVVATAWTWWRFRQRFSKERP